MAVSWGCFLLMTTNNNNSLQPNVGDATCCQANLNLTQWRLIPGMLPTDQKKENVKNMVERGKEMEKRRIKERAKSWKEEKKR